MSRAPRQLSARTLAMMKAGYTHVEEHGSISVAFKRGVTDEEKQEFRDKLSELLRPRRAYAKRTKRDPLAMEHAGERMLDESEPTPMAHNACVWFVRIYYVSMGDELLCFDAGPFVRVTADRAKSDASHHVPSQKWDEASQSWSKPDTLPQPIVWHATKDAEKISALTNAHRARHVVLPSQRAILHRQYNDAIAADPSLAHVAPVDDFDHTEGL